MQLQILAKKTAGSKPFLNLHVVLFAGFHLGDLPTSGWLVLEGTAVGVPTMVPDIDGHGKPDQAMCWNLDLVDARTDRVIRLSSRLLFLVNHRGNQRGWDYTFLFPPGMVIRPQLLLAKGCRLF